MASITVNSDAMREKATSFGTVADNIEKIIGEISSAVKSLQNNWKGTAAEKYAQDFLDMDATFQGLYSDIRAYRDFLNQAADAYDESEDASTAKE